MIRRNFVFDSGYSGIDLDNPTGAPNGIIEENIVRGVTGVGATGIRVDAGQGESAGLTIRDNSIDSSGSGIRVGGTSAVRVSGNVLRTDSTGIWINASLSCFISENRLYGNDAGNAITLHSSLDCLILRNVMRDYVNGIAVLLSDRHHIEGNVANGNSNWGIWFDDKSAYNTYGGNTARGNSGPACPVGPPIC